MKRKVTFTRIEKILEYIHENIRETLSLDELADKSCWSRWQLQRVFQDYTGFSVAQYVKEIKLSKAAELVLSSDLRILDIAFEFGFSSEVTFSRAFKQFFGVSPKQYKSNGVRTGIRTPLTSPQAVSSIHFPQDTLYQVRLERKKSFNFSGLPYDIKGFYSPSPDFSDSIPSAWQHFFSQVDSKNIKEIPHVGLINPTQNDGDLQYWAGVNAAQLDKDAPQLQNVVIEESTYAVLPYKGKVAEFYKAVIWMLVHWIPESGFQGVDNAYEVEVYYPPFDSNGEDIIAEYRIPIK